MARVNISPVSALIDIHLRTWKLVNEYFLRERPVDQLRRQLAHWGLL